MSPVLFENRLDAGYRLSEVIVGPREDVLVLGIARGGIPVGYPVANALGGELDVITARKLPIPWNPEAGFGAIAPDGSAVLNPEMVPNLGLSDEEMESIASEVLVEVRRREAVYREGHPPAVIEDRNVVITDDGLATGYTMIASIEMAKKQNAASITVAVPVSPSDTARRIEPMVDNLLCLHVARGFSFAVASFYMDFHDMSDDEVLELLRKARG